jgi:hypothetical protein
VRWLAASKLAVLVGLASLALAATPIVEAQDPEQPQGETPEKETPPEEAPPAPEEAAPKPAAPKKDTGLGTFFFEIDDWIAQPSGLEYRAATVRNPTDPWENAVATVEQNGAPGWYLRGGFGLHDDVGDIVLSYYRHTEDRHLESLTPGEFLYGEITTAGLFAGVNLDGLADGFSAETVTRIRDFRVDFARQAFESKGVSGKWLVGYRDMSHYRSLDTAYFAIAPNLPPILPPAASPRNDLIPRPDTAQISSSYEGRGLEAGFDVRFKVWRDKVWFDTGVVMAVLQGTMSTAYRSTTHFYGVVDQSGEIFIVPPPYDSFNECDFQGCFVDSVVQIATPVGVQDQSQSEEGSIIETNLALRYRFWKTAEFVVGYRSASYENVGQDLRTAEVEVGNQLIFASDGTLLLRLNPVTLERSPRSVEYEGVYFGVAFGF